MKQSRKMPADKRREQLLKAAKKVISKKGYAKATTEEIAREAGLTKGGLYFHFKNKEEVFFEVIKEHNEEIEEYFRNLLDDEQPIEEILNNLVKGIFNLIGRKDYFNLDFWQKANKVPKIKKYLEEQHKISRQFYTEYFSSRSNLSEDDVQFIHDLLHILVDGLVLQAQGFKHNPNLELLENGMQELIRLYLRRK